jgi:predicted GNAT family acetyltransferase
VSSGRLSLWESAGEAAASAYVSTTEAGVARVGFVYTPPQHRRSGFASAVVAAVSRNVLESGTRCILYAQLANPTSNALYRRLGYRPVGEIVRYSFE